MIASQEAGEKRGRQAGGRLWTFSEAGMKASQEAGGKRGRRAGGRLQLAASCLAHLCSKCIHVPVANGWGTQQLLEAEVEDMCLAEGARGVGLSGAAAACLAAAVACCCMCHVVAYWAPAGREAPPAPCVTVCARTSAAVRTPVMRAAPAPACLPACLLPA